MLKIILISATLMAPCGKAWAGGNKHEDFWNNTVRVAITTGSIPHSSCYDGSCSTQWTYSDGNFTYSAMIFFANADYSTRKAYSWTSAKTHADLHMVDTDTGKETVVPAASWFTASPR